jgi:hypothetical protein
MTPAQYFRISFQTLIPVLVHENGFGAVGLARHAGAMCAAQQGAATAGEIDKKSKKESKCSSVVCLFI